MDTQAQANPREHSGSSRNPVVTLLSVVAVLVILEGCVHPVSGSIQCEDWPKWEIFVPTHLAPTTINVQRKVPLA